MAQRLRRLVLDPIIPITYLLGGLTILTGLGGVLGLEPDVPLPISLFDIVYGCGAIGLGAWMSRRPASPAPRWIVAGLAAATCVLALVAIDVEGGHDIAVMAPALIAVIALGRLGALLLYPLFLALDIAINPSGADVLTPGTVFFNLLIIVTVWAARNQGIRATELAAVAMLAAEQAEARVMEEARLRHFLRFFQHELRNGVDGIRGLIPAARMLLDDADPAIRAAAGPSGVTVEQLLAAMERNAESLQRITQQLLILSRDRRLELAKQALPVLPLLGQICAEIAAQAAGQPAAISAAVSCDPALEVHGDATCLSLAVRTAARNALDALAGEGAPGTILLAGRATAGFVELEISDSGPGFADADLAHLRGAADEENLLGWTTKAGGNGLGVAFLIQVARLHGGTIDFRNRPGGGATVALALPRNGR